MKLSRKRVVALVAILVALILGGAWGSQIADDNGTPEAGFTWDEGQVPHGPSLKAQLGARVPKEVREMAAADARRLGLSLNQYVENLIVQANQGRPPVTILDGLITIEEAIAAVAEVVPVDVFDEGEMAAEANGASIIMLVPFARNCKNATLHWKSSPDNPCRFCGGQI